MCIRDSSEAMALLAHADSGIIISYLEHAIYQPAALEASQIDCDQALRLYAEHAPELLAQAISSSWIRSYTPEVAHEMLVESMARRRRESCTSVDTFARLVIAVRTEGAVSYTHLRAHETPEHLVCRLLLEKKKKHIRVL
eukprot:TRINITY_DN15719_c0_g1_i1.p1 TRINITY_DN15719_c0_g1~~TRINITY_DN15719_c0_g1_i1.p1  ORF type:complete len:140 (-),score=34.80 TRINITY_DN15719_c0_g1_i1:30-449(-)